MLRNFIKSKYENEYNYNSFALNPRNQNNMKHSMRGSQ